MPRPLRIEYKGAWYHVMNRGTNHQEIFHTQAHREFFLDLLVEVYQQFHIEIHAYCLMDNHYHLLLRTPHANLNRGMRYINGIYTQKYNRSLKRDGALFRGRYKAILIENDTYALQVSRYIHLNPVSAAICALPQDYKWSSYNAFLGNHHTTPWLQTSFLLSLAGNKYKNYVDAGLDSELTFFYGKKRLSAILGNKKFIDAKLNSLNNQYKSEVATDVNHTRPLPSLEFIATIVAKHFNVDLSKLKITKKGRKNIERTIAIYLSRRVGQHTHRDIALYFTNIESISISALLKRYTTLIQNNKQLKKDTEALKEKIVHNKLLSAST